jgi:hypothetical protein
VYAVPVVELCAGRDTAADVVPRALTTMTAVGREPVVVRAEVPGLVGNRLTAALLREALDLVARGVVDADGVERIVARGIATGWITDGPLRTEWRGAGEPERARGAATFDVLASLWPALTGRDALGASERATVQERLASLEAATDAGDADDCAWARAIHAVLRAARERAT